MSVLLDLTLSLSRHWHCSCTVYTADQSFVGELGSQLNASTVKQLEELIETIKGNSSFVTSAMRDLLLDGNSLSSLASGAELLVGVVPYQLLVASSASLIVVLVQTFLILAIQNFVRIEANLRGLCTCMRNLSHAAC